MRALQELFSSDVGLMSVVVLAITLGMGVFCIRFFTQHAKDKPPGHGR
jgi:hypothetical protein